MRITHEIGGIRNPDCLVPALALFLWRGKRNHGASSPLPASSREVRVLTGILQQQDDNFLKIS